MKYNTNPLVFLTPVTVLSNPEDNIGRRISSDEKRQNCGFELVAIEIVN